jgi:DNA-binding transcriptional LysR family regulator
MDFRRRHDIPPALLRSFVAIDQLGSYSKAAEELGLTQPAISGQMKRLQELVGGDVFVKNAVGLSLSELGLLVDRYARRILTLNDQVIALAGKVHNRQTIRLAVQNAFALNTLADVKNKCALAADCLFQFICGNAREVDHLVTSGYVDLAFGFSKTEARRNLLTTWNEKLAWARAPDIFPVQDNEPLPFVGRKAGFMDEKVLQRLDDVDVPYQVTFRGSDLGALIAAVMAGIGIMVAPARFIPEPLIDANTAALPELPEMAVGVSCREGLDLKRHKAVVAAFISAVTPPNTKAAIELHKLHRPVNGAGTAQGLPSSLVAAGFVKEPDTV